MEYTIEKLLDIFKGVEKPHKAKGCDCPFCITDNEILELLNKPPLSLTEKDLSIYVQNVFTTIGSVQDFTYMLPSMLKVWSIEIYKRESTFCNFFHSALARDTFLYKYLSAELRDAVVQFMRTALLKRAGLESSLYIVGKSLTHAWFGILAAYGKFTKDIPELWSKWWTFPSEGHAIAAVQYASSLIYNDEKNPIFAPWTEMQGGGAPVLWESATYVSDQVWLKENIDFLEKILTTEYLKEKLDEAKKRLADTQKINIVEHMEEVLNKENKSTERRIEEVINNLRTLSD